jgi:hypothetical protein
MRMLFAIRSPGFFVRFFDGTLRELNASGHSIEIVSHFGHQKAPEDNAVDRALYDKLRGYEREMKQFHWQAAQPRIDRWRAPLSASRRLLDYASYVSSSRQASQMVVERSKGYLPAPVRRALQYRAPRDFLHHPAVYQILRRAERLAPPDRAITQSLQEMRPDVVVASPMLMARSDEQEYIRAAKKLGIPTVVAVKSWDNLTTKGILHVIPDMTLVWNQGQVEEAVRIHQVPRDQVMVTGAPIFDEWFNMRPTLDRAAFCRQAGLDPERPYILYLCSSWSIAQDETPFVEQVARALHEHSDTRSLSLLVRPHPSNDKIWQNYTSDLFSIWPPVGVIPVTTDARQDFYHALYYSAAALGINTSALIETAIVDRPVITILAERYRDTQREIKHFQHLLDADFLELAPDIPAARAIASAILQGTDSRRGQRRRFVHDFIRPWGLDRPASVIMARVIEAVGQGLSADAVRALLASEMGPPVEASVPSFASGN